MSQKGPERFRKKLGLAAVAAALAAGAWPAAAVASSSGSNNGQPPDQGNCLGNFVNQGSQGYNVSNFGPPEPSDLGQSIGKEEHGCRN